MQMFLEEKDFRDRETWINFLRKFEVPEKFIPITQRVLVEGHWKVCRGVGRWEQVLSRSLDHIDEN